MKSEKRGQLEMSFGMIFSIIIIIATIGVAFYVISHFVKVNNCAQIGIFYQDLQERVDKAWQEDRTQGTFTGKLPGSVEQVCFGNFTQSYDPKDEEEFEYLKRYRNEEVNLFLYPPVSACGNDLATYNLKHSRADKFFCISPKKGELVLKVTKDVSDILVKIE